MAATSSSSEATRRVVRVVTLTTDDEWPTYELAPDEEVLEVVSIMRETYRHLRLVIISGAREADAQT